MILVAPPALDPGAEMEVQFVSDGKVLVKTRLKLSVSDTVELVGVMPGIAARIGKVPKSAQLLSGLGRAEIEEIGDEVFTLGATALSTYDTIVAAGGDLQSLDDLGKSSLYSWLNHGGRLVLDDDAGNALLPAAWQPDEAAYALAGRGEVRLVNGLASAGKFSDIIEPSSPSGVSETGVGFGATEIFSSAQDDLAKRAGVRLPSLTPILFGLLAYIIVVGPLCYLVLRRRRRLAAAWVAIPTIAVVAAVVVLFSARSWRDNGKPAAVAFVDGYPGGSESQVTLLSFQRSGGVARVTTPAGWQIQSTQLGFNSFDVQHRFTMSNDGSLFQARLEPGQVTSAEFVGPSLDVGLNITAVAAGKKITGTVTNNSGTRLADVAVFGAGDADKVGALEPGESSDYSIDAQPLPFGFTLVDRVWSRPENPAGPAGSGPASELAEFGVWGSASTHLPMYPIGLVRAAGWTDDRLAETVTGSPLPTRTVVTETTVVQPGEGPLSSGAIRTTQVRSPFNQFGGGNGESAIRYVLPPNAATQKLVVEAAFGMDVLQFWDGKTWQKVTLKNRLAVVPPAALRNGAVLMRIQPDANFGFDPSQVLLMRGATDKDKV